MTALSEGIRTALGAKSLRIRAEPVVEKVAGAGAYILRVSFGTTLLAGGYSFTRAHFRVQSVSARALHSLTFQLNLSHFTLRIPRNVLTMSL
jgi:hypothetical protein